MIIRDGAWRDAVFIQQPRYHGRGAYYALRPVLGALLRHVVAAQEIDSVRKAGVWLSWNRPASACTMSPVKHQTIRHTPTLCRKREYGGRPRKRGNAVYSHPQFIPTPRSRRISGAAQNSSSHAGTSALYISPLCSGNKSFAPGTPGVLPGVGHARPPAVSRAFISSRLLAKYIPPACPRRKTPFRPCAPAARAGCRNSRSGYR